MKSSLLNKAPLAVAVSMIMMAGAASAGSNNVPASGDEWFAQGQRALKETRHELPNLRKAKNVILFVGDGMGISTVTASRILEGQLRGEDGEFNRLSFEKFPYLALSVTASHNQQTSDSAPTATAMVAGIKTNDGAISTDPAMDRNETDASVVAAHSVKTILEQAEERGMSTGVVSTARITHATPAVNYAHIGNRDWENNTSLPAGATVKDIAAQLIDMPYGDGIEVVLGGGRSNFTTNTMADPEYPTRTGSRTDGRDLTAEWETMPKSEYVWNQDQFDAINPKKTKHLLGLFERSHMKYEADRENDVAGEPSLADMTQKAISMLKQNRKGFYLMVESGRIDHAHHAGNAHRALTDAIALSEAVKVAKEMTGEDTLIVVTADHSHVFTLAGYPSRGNPILGKAAIDGVELTDALGLPYTTLGYANGPGFTGAGTRQVFNPANEGYVASDYIGTAARPDLSGIDTTDPNYLQEAAVPMGAETHAGEEVAIYATGPKAYLFRGVQEQNYIYHVMAEALGFNNKGWHWGW